MRRFVHLYHNGCCGEGEATHIEISNEYIKFQDRFSNELVLSYKQWIEIEAVLKDDINKADELLEGLSLSNREKGQLKFYIDRDKFNITSYNRVDGPTNLS